MPVMGGKEPKVTQNSPFFPLACLFLSVFLPAQSDYGAGPDPSPQVKDVDSVLAKKILKLQLEASESLIFFFSLEPNIMRMHF